MSEMLIREHHLDVDFQKDIFKARYPIRMVQEDHKSNLLIFNFKDNLPDWESAILRIKHYAGTMLEYSLDIKNKRAELLVTGDVTSTPGTIKMAIELVGTDGETLTITDCQDNIIIKEKVDGTIPEGFEQSVLEDLVSRNTKLKEIIANLEGNLALLEEIIDQINGEKVYGTVFDKLTYLSETKEIFKYALMEKRQEIDDEVTFRKYAHMLEQMENNYGFDYIKLEINDDDSNLYLISCMDEVVTNPFEIDEDGNLIANDYDLKSLKYIINDENELEVEINGEIKSGKNRG